LEQTFKNLPRGSGYSNACLSVWRLRLYYRVFTWTGTCQRHNNDNYVTNVLYV